MIENNPQGQRMEFPRAEEAAEAEEARAYQLSVDLAAERNPGLLARLEDRYQEQLRNEERLARERRILKDPTTSHCHGCGRLRPLWELELLRVPPGELEPGAPLTVKLFCLDHGVGVRVPEHEWDRPSRRRATPAEVAEIAEAVVSRLTSMEQEQLRRRLRLGAALHGPELERLRRIAEEHPPAKPLPDRVPREVTVGFWRSTVGRAFGRRPSEEA